MAIKQLAISFGIGATISGAFIKNFKNASGLIGEVTKRTDKLKASQLDLKKINKLKLADKGIVRNLKITQNQLDNLSKSIQATSKAGIGLKNTYNSLKKEVVFLEEEKKILVNKTNEVSKKLEENKENSNNLKTEYHRLKLELINVNSELKNSKNISSKTKKETISLKEEKKKLINKITELSKKLEENKGNSSSLKAEYYKLKSELEDVNNKLKTSKNNFSQVGKAINTNNKETSSLEKQYDSLKNKMENLSKTQAKNNEEFEKTKKILEEQNISIKDTAKSYSELERKIERSNKALAKYQKAERLKEKGNQVSSLGTKSFQAAGIMTGIGYGTLNTAIKAESAFADVKKQFDFKTKEEEEKFKSDLQKIVTEKKIAISLEDLYQMTANAGQSGLSKDEAISYVEEVSKMAVAFNMSRDEASRYMFTWKNAFNMNLDQLKELSDQINILGNNTGASESQISEFLTRLGNIPKLAGMAENQTAALGASLIEMGMAPEVAATGAKKLLNVLSKGMAADKSEKEALDMLGLDAEYLSVMAKKDSEKAMDLVFSKLSKVKETKQSAIMAMLFGEEGKVAGANILSSYEKYIKNLSLVKDKNSYQGATEKEYLNRENTTENRLRVLKTQYDILKADFGTELLPLLEEGMGYVSSILGSITKFMKEDPEGTKKIIKTFAYGTATLYGFGLGLKGIAILLRGYALYSKIAGAAIEKNFVGRSVKNLKNFGKATGNVIKGMGKTTLKGISMLATPTGLVIAGIVALVAAGYLLYKNWDKVKKKASELKEKVSELVDKYWYMLGPFGHLFKAGKMIYENWDTIKLKASELKEKLVDMVMNGIENFSNFKEKAIAVLGIPFDYMKEKIENLKNLGRDLKDYFLGIFEEIKNFSLTGAIKNGISSLWNKGKEMLPGFANGGFVSSPTLAMVGEGGYSEAVIPLNNDPNSLNLWEKTGRLIGAYENKNSSSNSYNEFKFTYAPVVNASDSTGVREVLEKDAHMKYEEFKNYFDRYQKEMFRRGNGR